MCNVDLVRKGQVVRGVYNAELDAFELVAESRKGHLRRLPLLTLEAQLEGVDFIKSFVLAQGAVFSSTCYQLQEA